MRLKLILLFLFGWIGIHAEETMLVLEKHNGSRSTFMLSDKPEIYFSGNLCFFICKSNTISVERNDIADFHFEKGVNAVENIKASDIHTYFIDDNTIGITGIEQDAVKVFDTSGKVMDAAVEGASGNVTVSLSSLPSGIYIVKYSSNTIKITKK